MLSVLGLDFLLLTGHWEKNIVAEALLPVVLAEAEAGEAETEKTPLDTRVAKCHQYV